MGTKRAKKIYNSADVHRNYTISQKIISTKVEQPWKQTTLTWSEQ